MAKIIDGKAIATNLNGQLQNEVAALSFVPGLAVVLVGDDPASQVYVRGKIKVLEDDLRAGRFHPFTGPVVDQSGKTIVPAGQSMTDDQLNKMNYYLEGVVSKIPN